MSLVWAIKIDHHTSDWILQKQVALRNTEGDMVLKNVSGKGSHGYPWKGNGNKGQWIDLEGTLN